jgi:hypothetical protein
MSQYNISLWQQDLSHPGATIAMSPIFSQFSYKYLMSTSNQLAAKNPNDGTPNSYVWVVQTYQFNLDFSNVFFLGCGFDSGGTGFTSSYFNITANANLPSSNTTAPSNNSAWTASSSASATVSSSSNAATKVGLGVGLGLGIPILLLLAVLVGANIMRGRRKASNTEYPPAHLPMYYQGPPVEAEALSKNAGPFELGQSI